MGLFDFIFGNKKEKERLLKERQVEQDRIHLANEKRIAENRERRLAENRRKEAERQTSVKPENLTIPFEPFTFESNQHQRYESGNPILGLQKCPRTINVEKNLNGCSGYQLNPGDGYIVRMINGDTGKEQMSAKPMRIIRSSSSEVLLRGYKVNAMTPFGFQEIDMADYGLSISLSKNQVSKYTLHMYDRDIDIEYYKTNDLEIVDTL